MNSSRRPGWIAASLLTAFAVATPSVVWAAPPASEAETAAAPAGEAPVDGADAGASIEGSEPPAEPTEGPEMPEPEPEPEAASEPEPEPEAVIADADLPDAEARYYRAVEHFNLGKYDLAVPLFEAVYREVQSPDLLFNLGQSHWKWFNTDPDVAHLQQARTMFLNYDKALRGTEGYNYREVEAYLAAIDAQIRGIEASARVELKPLERPTGLDPKVLEYERQRRINTGLSVTGVTFSVLGGLSLVTGGVALAIRSGNGFALDQAGKGTTGRPNPFSAEEYEQLRTNYLRTGQVAFGTLIAGAVLFPIGITLAAIGNQRNKRLVHDSRFAWMPSPSGIGFRF